MRNLTVPLILIGTFAVCGSALANEVSMHKHTAEEVKAVCDKVGGKFSEASFKLVMGGHVICEMPPLQAPKIGLLC